MFPSKLEQNKLKANIAASYNKLYSEFSTSELREVGNYKLLNVVGEGSFGKVYLASHRLTHQKVVLKMGSKNDPNVVREVFYHRQFDYIYITKLYEVIVTENHVWMALEYCPGKELYDYLLNKKQIPLAECAQLFSQIVGGVYYAHSMKCVHRDLKLENILLDNKGQAKLTDFGFTRECATKGILETVCGTTVYMAPELIERKPYEGYKTDIWSLGIILFTLIHGCMPFEEEDESKTKFKIVNENPVYNRNLVDSAGEDLISTLLNKDPQQRPSLAQVLQHPFLQPYGIQIFEKTEKILKRQSHGTKQFHSKLERKLLKRLKQCGFDTQAIKHSVNRKRCDSLSGLWFLLVEKEKRCESLRHPKRSRSVLSVKKVFDNAAPSRKSTEELKKSDTFGKATSLKRIMSRKSDTASIRPPSQTAQNKGAKNPEPLDGVVSQTSSGKSAKRPNLFHKMTSFFKNKRQPPIAADKQSISPNSGLTDKRKRNAISFESRKNSPQRSPTRSGNNAPNENNDTISPATPNGHSKFDILRIEEPRLKKFKSNTSSEMSRQNSLGNFDSELDHKAIALNGQSNYDESTNDISKTGPVSILSQQSEMSNDTYNSEYSTDGNASNSKPASSLSSHTTRNGNGVILSPNVDSVDSSSLQSRTNLRGSMSIMSSASSASEKSSRTDSFYEISTASSPKTMDLRAMHTYANADSTVPRSIVGSQWLAKRGRSPVGRRGRLPKRNISRKLLNKNTSAAQSVIQEEGSFDDEDDNAELPPVHVDVSALGGGPNEPKCVLPQEPSSLPVTTASIPETPPIDRRPVLFDMTRSLSGSSGVWSHNFLEDRNSETALKPNDIHDEHSILGIADDEDNSFED
ncbi:LAFA_0B05864g1_1 [Lachancea sp. 'fantastica']|nr:LAFA_0B05864g1_1 [Lachancea sp. 'fantastica']